MPEIIDVLSIPLAECQNFVVDHTVDYVTATIPAGNNRYQNSALNNIFIKGDSLRILSCGFKMPEAFTRWDSVNPLPIFLQAAKGVVSGALYFNPNMPSSYSYIPFESYEFVLDVFFDCRLSYRGGDPALNLLLENFYIVGNLFGAQKISMQGVPSALDGKTFYIVPFIKVLHSLPMIT